MAPPVVPAAGGPRTPIVGFRAGSTVADLMLRAMGHRVLLVEDEPDIVVPLVQALEREGYAVDQARTGRAALAAVSADRDHAPDVVVLDLGLPDLDGLEVCQQLRAEGFDGGVLILSGRGEELDRVVGLDAGADDYLAKPFGLAELLARLRALLRRTAARVDGHVDAGRRLRVDVDAHRVHVGDREVALTGKEFDVLAVLATNRDKVVSRAQLMAEVWSEGWYGSTKTLDVTIGRLRQKLDQAGPLERVVTVRGVGFRLET